VILLARHGETDDNLPPLRFQGSTDTPLNDTGRAQAEELGGQLAADGEPLAALYSSQLSRALETAQIVGARIGLAPRVDSRLAEAHRGDWEGFTFDEIAARDPAGFAAFRRAGEDFRFPGGESLREQMDRVVAALAAITAARELPALAVCHGGSIRVALCHTDRRGLDAFWEPDVPNCSVIRL
jgi:broad specificity phosphatase PhoE